MKHSMHRALGARIGLAGCVALAGLCLGFAPAPEPTSGAAVVVAVWDSTGVPLDGASVSAFSDDGGSKAVPQGNGMYLLPSAGLQYGDLIKAAIEVQHPVWGSASVDMLFEAAPMLRLELVYMDHDVVDAFSPQEVSGGAPSPGDGAPANDDCSGAVAMEAGDVVSGSTAGATLDAVTACGTSITAPGVWYSVTGTGNTMTATTCGNFFGYDTKVTVFCGTCDELNCLAGNDDDCGAASGLLSTVSWCSEPGATYYVLVHGFSDDTGAFDLAVSDDGSPCAGAAACLPKGACCFVDGSCDQATAAGCAAAGGTYGGDGVECFATAGSETFTSTPLLSIPDFDVGGVSDSQLVGSSFAIGDLNLAITVDHTWQGDLIVTLRHEDTGTEVTVVDRIGEPAIGPFGCGEDNWAGVVLDDEAGSSIEDVCVPNLTSPPNQAPFPGLLSAFDGEDVGGTWTLTISDNAEFDTGRLVSWSLVASEAGSPVCPQPECFLVIGDGPGAGSFYGASHEFDTQVADVADSYPVLMENIPSFVLPPLMRGAPAVGTALPHGGAAGSDLEAWMQDGHFAVQVLMWNPQVFPGQPEQYTAGLEVTVKANGTVQAVPYGDDVGGLTIEAQIDTLPDGTRVISFPFQIPGF